MIQLNFFKTNMKKRKEYKIEMEATTYRTFYGKAEGKEATKKKLKSVSLRLMDKFSETYSKLAK